MWCLTYFIKNNTFRMRNENFWGWPNTFDWWCIYIYIKLATVVEGHPKASFLVATTQWCRGGTSPFPGLLHFTLDMYLIILRYWYIYLLLVAYIYIYNDHWKSSELPKKKIKAEHFCCGYTISLHIKLENFELVFLIL